LVFLCAVANKSAPVNTTQLYILSNIISGINQNVNKNSAAKEKGQKAREGGGGARELNRKM
jgi:hypothetical protein